MPRNTFASVPTNRGARKKIFRTARLGQRPAPVIPDIGNALKTISVAGAYKDGWQDSPANPAVTVRAAWNDRKSY